MAVAQEPLTRGQLRAWAVQQVVADPAAHASALCYDIPAEVDAQVLERALRDVVDRHDVLRTWVVVEDGEPTRSVEPAGSFRLVVVDLRADPDPVARARALVVDFAERQVTPALGGPVLRALLVRVDDRRDLLAVVVHHIAWDTGSRAALHRELSQSYAEYAAGREPAGKVLRFADIAAGEAAEPDPAALAYWRDRLDGSPDHLALPFDRPRSPTRGLRAGEVGFEIAPEVVARLDGLARGQGASLFEVGLACYQALLARYCATTDVVVGVPAGDRPLLGGQRAIGPLDNPVAIRTEITGDPPLHRLVEAVRAEVAAAAAAAVPFDQVVAHLRAPRDLSKHPVFQAWFELCDEVDPLRLAGVEATRFALGTDRQLVDLALRWELLPSGAVSGTFGYATDLFDRATITRFADHYLNFLFAAAEHPGRPLSSVQIFFAGEWDEQIHAANRTDAPLPPHPTVAAWFEDQVARTPGATALVAGQRSFSYAELNARANRLAHHLRGQGIGVGSLVALCLPREADMVVAVLAVFKAGAAYLPVDPGQPAARIAYYLGDAGANLVLTKSNVLNRLPAERPRTVVVEDIADELAAAPAHNPGPHATENDLAYVVYTSGSTGAPKGVAMPHRPLLNLIAWQVRWSAAPGPTWQFAALSFDPSFKELFGTLVAGETAVLVDDVQRTDPDELLTLLRSAGVRRMLFCPPMVLDVLALSAVPLDEQPPLREITTGGDRLRLTATTKKWLEQLPGLSLTNGYGLTETHLVTAARLTGDVTGWPEHPPVGAPLSNVRVYLLDHAMRPVPVGAVGEIFVGGAGVSWGYLGRPAATARRFLPDPFADAPGARLYRSGDLARRGQDGALEFLGRADHQVKVRGHRIEPAEVEAALMAFHPTPRAALVVPVDRDDDVRLAAYVVPADEVPPGGGTGAAAIRAHLRATLPSALQPAHVMLLPELPMTSRGKVDRSRLPAPDEAGAAGGPLTRAQAAVADIWRHLLGTPRIGPDDNFFELGGHSLLVPRVCHALLERFGARVAPRALFENQTVREVAAVVAHEEGNKRWRDASV
ncbi:amino acid adenylation domain-containing protein [Actinokineospora baliensis]|uniref:non-ribosomal peptide synthetase n=1 Tax=Actinokineospora baliensis TaxID=547056 RepID=UPI00195C0DE9|nr:non-ribosomal peptide synthetase [Actinokineospora baliensis]MBM7775499.1 amino acid adenylation domain-containing protein [Actinokineospora baliensis]